LWFALKFGPDADRHHGRQQGLAKPARDRGLFTVAGIAGLADVDAITSRPSSMVKQGQAALDVAAIAV